MNQSPILYRPPSPHSSPTHSFITFINHRHAPQPPLETYDVLWQWSVDNIAAFWDAVWDFTQVVGHKGNNGEPCVDETATPADNPLWFPNATLNWAQNALQCRSPSKIALIQATEPHPSDPSPAYRSLPYSTLYTSTLAAASALLALGVRPGDRVASYASNCIENTIAFLGAAAVGAIWTSAAADFAPPGVLERFVQVEPKVVFSVNFVSYNHKLHPHLPKLHALLDGLAAANKSPRAVVIIPFKPVSAEEDAIPIPGAGMSTAQSWKAFLALGNERKLGWIFPTTNSNQNNDSDPNFKTETEASIEFAWHPTPFNAPLWILFSSGTTGAPKAIVHRSGGMLLQAKKEFVICAGLTASDVFFYYTTTGWMMWNFLVGALPLGCTLVLYDGSPLRDPGICWRFVDDLGISVFGTSAKYLEQVAKRGYVPNKRHTLERLRHVYSTGSPLAGSLFEWVYEAVARKEGGDGLLLASITGGTDICSTFAGFNSSLAVIRGEIQCRMLGMAVAAVEDEDADADSPRAPLALEGAAGVEDAEGGGLEGWEGAKEVEKGTQGELVCLRPFPCQPIGFWPLEGFGTEEEVSKAKERFYNAYFAGGRKGVWYHGDHVIVMPSREGNGGGVVMLGRSDGVLNPGGIRFGSAEIYDVIHLCFSEGTLGLSRDMTVVDALCVGQKIGLEKADERVLLFVQLLDGVHLSKELNAAIAKEVRSRRSPRHVPAKCIQVQDIPHTLNGKKVEVPVRKIMNGAPLSSINLATLRNPECLPAYVDLARGLGEEAARL